MSFDDPRQRNRLFQIKYDRHPDFMEPLLKAYGEEMLRLLAGDA